jgi:hypothetical protein
VAVVNIPAAQVQAVLVTAALVMATELAQLQTQVAAVAVVDRLIQIIQTAATAVQA